MNEDSMSILPEKYSLPQGYYSRPDLGPYMIDSVIIKASSALGLGNHGKAKSLAEAESSYEESLNQIYCHLYSFQDGTYCITKEKYFEFLDAFHKIQEGDTTPKGYEWLEPARLQEFNQQSHDTASKGEYMRAYNSAVEYLQDKAENSHATDIPQPNCVVL